MKVEEMFNQYKIKPIIKKDFWKYLLSNVIAYQRKYGGIIFLIQGKTTERGFSLLIYERDIKEMKEGHIFKLNKINVYKRLKNPIILNKKSFENFKSEVILKFLGEK